MLAPLFAQVEHVIADAEYAAERQSGDTASMLALRRVGHAKDALSSIERHVQDMETALERIGRGVCSNVMAGFEECDRQRTFDDFCAVCHARALLSAREKEEE